MDVAPLGEQGLELGRGPLRPDERVGRECLPRNPQRACTEGGVAPASDGSSGEGLSGDIRGRLRPRAGVQRRAERHRSGHRTPSVDPAATSCVRRGAPGGQRAPPWMHRAPRPGRRTRKKLQWLRDARGGLSPSICDCSGGELRVHGLSPRSQQACVAGDRAATRPGRKRLALVFSSARTSDQARAAPTSRGTGDRSSAANVLAAFATHADVPQRSGHHAPPK